MGNCCSSCWPWRKADSNLENEGLEVEKSGVPPERPNARLMQPDASIQRSSAALEQPSPPLKESNAVPSASQYYIKTGKTAVEILQAAAEFVPIPLVKEVLGVVLTLIGTCEKVTALQGQLNDLKDQLCSLGIILFNSVEGENLPLKTHTRIAKLRANLETIISNLQDILDQGKVVLGLFADANQGSVDDCVKRLNVALTEFHVTHEIATEQDLYCILQRLEGMSSQLNHVDEGVQQVGRGVEEIKALMKSLQPHNAPNSSSGMPVKLRHFRGHELLVTGIGNLLCSNEPAKPHIAILATGGMGKTTMAVEVMESDMVKRNYENRFWVSCKGATSSALFLRVLKTSLRIKTDSGDLLADIKSELTASNAPRLIVLDNFETPWEANKEDVESVLASLASICHVAILITMRSHFPPSENIEWHVEELKPLDIKASREIYIDVNPSAKDHEALDELLIALGHMPYAIKLIATLGKKSTYQPNALLKIWKEKGPKTVGDEINHSIGLSVNSNFMQSHPEALSLFKTLSMLPEGATLDHIEKWWATKLGSDLPLAIATLNDTALISMLEMPSDSPKYFVYPVVQSYMKHLGQISAQDRIDLQEAAFKFILDHKSSPGDPKFKDDLKVIATEDVNLQGILEFAAQRRMENYGQSNEIFDKTLLDALLTFSLYQLRSKPTLDIATLAVDVARKLDVKPHLAEGLDCLGRIRLHLSDYDGAGDALEEARELFNSCSNPLRSVQTAYHLMSSYTLDNNSLAANALEEELRADLMALTGSDHHQLCAIAQLAIGRREHDNGHFLDALTYFSDSRKEFERIVRSYEGAECLALLCQCYGNLGKYPECMEAAQYAAREFEYLGLDADRNYVRGLECNLFLVLEDYDQALHVSEIYLQESRRLGSVLGIARALEYIAQVFEQRGDVAAVRLGYESALEQYKIIGNSAEGQQGIRCCEDNLELLAQAIAEDEDEDDEGDITSDGRRLMPQLWHGSPF